MDHESLRILYARACRTWLIGGVASARVGVSGFHRRFRNSKEICSAYFIQDKDSLWSMASLVESDRDESHPDLADNKTSANSSFTLLG